jgi:hypothetical protein
MTTYETFIETKIKLADDATLCEYRVYLTNCEFNQDGTEHYIIENSDKWFTIFVDYLNNTIEHDEIDFDFEYFDKDNIYKEVVCYNYCFGQYHKSDEICDLDYNEEYEDILNTQIRHARNNKNDMISMNFYIAYVNGLTFEYFKTLLYENGIYNDIFADQIDLK